MNFTGAQFVGPSNNQQNNQESYYYEQNEYQDQHPQEGNYAPIQFNTMVLESYEAPKNEENIIKEEFVFPFHQESETETAEMSAFRSDNMNTYNLCNQKEPLIDGIPLGSNPTPLEPQATNLPTSPRAPFPGTH